MAMSHYFHQSTRDYSPHHFSDTGFPCAPPFFQYHSPHFLPFLGHWTLTIFKQQKQFPSRIFYTTAQQNHPPVGWISSRTELRDWDGFSVATSIPFLTRRQEKSWVKIWKTDGVTGDDVDLHLKTGGVRGKDVGQWWALRNFCSSSRPSHSLDDSSPLPKTLLSWPEDREGFLFTSSEWLATCCSILS